MQQTAVGSITIKRLRTGDSLQLTLSCPKSLFQIVDDNGNNPTPDWTTVANQPTITPIITSLRKQKITLVSCKWSLDGNEVASISSSGQTQVVTGYAITPVSTSNPFGNLTIKTNMPSSAGAYTHVLTYEASVLTGNNTTPDTITLSKDIEVRRLSSSAYWGQIQSSNGDVLGIEDSSGKQIESTTLVPHLYQGQTEMTSGFTVQWYKVQGGGSPDYNNDPPITATNSGEDVYLNGTNLVVKRAGVNGMAYFICRFFVSGSDVESAGIAIKDNADTFMIVISGDSQVDANGGSTTIKAQVYNLDKGENVKANAWSVDVKNAETLQDITLTTTPSTGTDGVCTLVVKEADMKYRKDDKDIECDVVVTFEATI